MASKYGIMVWASIFLRGTFVATFQRWQPKEQCFPGDSLKLCNFPNMLQISHQRKYGNKCYSDVSLSGKAFWDNQIWQTVLL